TLGREDQHPGGVTGLTESLDDGQPIASGEHQIEHDRVVPFPPRQVESLIAVGCMIDGISCLSKPAHHERTNRGIVFDNEDAHIFRILDGSRLSSPWRNATGCESAEASFRMRRRESGNSPAFSASLTREASSLC